MGSNSASSSSFKSPSSKTTTVKTQVKSYSTPSTKTTSSSGSASIKSTVSNIKLGFNEFEVRNSLNRLQNIYNDMLSGLVNFTNSFLNNMGNSWACPEAISFARNIFCPEFNSFVTKIDNSIQNLFEVINNSARSWAASSNAPYNKINFVRFAHKSFDALSFRNDINGNVGIDTVLANSNLSYLDKINNLLNTSLSNMVNVLRTTSFVGKGQQEALIQSVNSVKNGINNKYTSIMVEIKKQIKATIEKYVQTANTVSSSFSSLK